MPRDAVTGSSEDQVMPIRHDHPTAIISHVLDDPEFQALRRRGKVEIGRDEASGRIAQGSEGPWQRCYYLIISVADDIEEVFQQLREILARQKFRFVAPAQALAV